MKHQLKQKAASSQTTQKIFQKSNLKNAETEQLKSSRGQTKNKQKIEMVNKISKGLDTIPTISHKNEVIMLSSYLKASSQQRPATVNLQQSQSRMKHTQIDKVVTSLETQNVYQLELEQVKVNPKLLKPVRSTINIPPELHFSKSKSKRDKSASNRKNQSQRSLTKSNEKGFNQNSSSKVRSLSKNQKEYSRDKNEPIKSLKKQESQLFASKLLDSNLKEAQKNLYDLRFSQREEIQQLVEENSIDWNLSQNESQEARYRLEAINQAEDKFSITTLYYNGQNTNPQTIASPISRLQFNSQQFEAGSSIIDGFSNTNASNFRFINLQDGELQNEGYEEEYPNLEKYYIDLANSNNKASASKFHQQLNPLTERNVTSQFETQELGYQSQVKQNKQLGPELCPTISALNFSTIDFRSEFNNLQSFEKHSLPQTRRKKSTRCLRLSQSSGQLSILVQKIKSHNVKQVACQLELQQYAQDKNTYNEETTEKLVQFQNDQSNNSEDQDIEASREVLMAQQRKLLQQKSKSRFEILKTKMNQNLEMQRQNSRERLMNMTTSFSLKPFTPYKQRKSNKENMNVQIKSMLQQSKLSSSPLKENSKALNSSDHQRILRERSIISPKKVNGRYTSEHNDQNQLRSFRTKTENQNLLEYKQSAIKQQLKLSKINGLREQYSSKVKLLSPKFLRQQAQQNLEKYKHNASEQCLESSLSGARRRKVISDNYEWLL